MTKLKFCSYNYLKLLSALELVKVPVPIYELSSLTGLPSSHLSFYLDKLHKAGLVEKIVWRKHGCVYTYSLTQKGRRYLAYIWIRFQVDRLIDLLNKVVKNEQVQFRHF